MCNGQVIYRVRKMITHCGVENIRRIWNSQSQKVQGLVKIFHKCWVIEIDIFILGGIFRQCSKVSLILVIVFHYFYFFNSSRMTY